MPRNAEIVGSKFTLPSWAEFKKYIDGTHASLAFFFDEMSDFYYIFTEAPGGVHYTFALKREAGDDLTDFETNFKVKPPKISTQPSGVPNKTVAITYLGNGNIDKIETTIGTSVRTEQFNYDGSGNLQSVTSTTV